MVRSVDLASSVQSRKQGQSDIPVWKLIKASNPMKYAFVIRLGTESRPEEDFFEGWVEEVDSCTEKRFHSTAELLSFLGQCFNKVALGNPAISKSEKDPRTRKKKNCH